MTQASARNVTKSLREVKEAFGGDRELRQGEVGGDLEDIDIEGGDLDGGEGSNSGSDGWATDNDDENGGGDSDSTEGIESLEDELPYSVLSGSVGVDTGVL